MLAYLTNCITAQPNYYISYFIASQGLTKDNLLQLIEYLHSLKEAQILTLSTNIDTVKKQLHPLIEQCKQRSKYDKELFLIKAKPLFDIHELQFQLKAHAVEQETGPTPHTNNEQCGSATSSTGSTYLSKNTQTNSTKGSKQQDHLNQCTKISQTDCMKNNKSPRDTCDESKREGQEKTNETDNRDHSYRKINTKNNGITIANVAVKRKALMTTNDSAIGHSNSQHEIANNTHLCITNCNKQTRNNNTFKKMLNNNDKENERRIELAMRFCSRSIKSSSKVNSLKTLNSQMKKDMGKVLSLAKNSSSAIGTRQSKRKREHSPSSAFSKSHTDSLSCMEKHMYGKRLRVDESVNNSVKRRVLLR